MGLGNYDGTRMELGGMELEWKVGIMMELEWKAGIQWNYDGTTMEL